jgi:hypothetical protein
MEARAPARSMCRWFAMPFGARMRQDCYAGRCHHAPAYLCRKNSLLLAMQHRRSAQPTRIEHGDRSTVGLRRSASEPHSDPDRARGAEIDRAARIARNDRLVEQVFDPACQRCAMPRRKARGAIYGERAGQGVGLEIILIVRADIAQGRGERRAARGRPCEGGARRMGGGLRRAEAVKCLPRCFDLTVGIGIARGEGDIVLFRAGIEFDPLRSGGLLKSRDVSQNCLDPP